MLGPLAGVPLLVKDNIDTAGLPTAAATPALAANRPARDAGALSSLFEAGGLLLGKTNTDELAFGNTGTNPATGTIHNPCGVNHISGGSSGGTVAGIAARISPIGLGTDTSGSIRTPASLYEVVGLRPTVGRYPAGGTVPASHTRDAIGPMARTVTDVALLDSIMAGVPPHEAVRLDGIRLGLPSGEFWAGLNEETDLATRNAVRLLRDAGATFVEVKLPLLTECLAAVEPILAFEAIADLRTYLVNSCSAVTIQQVVDAIRSPVIAQFYRAFLAGGTDLRRYRVALETGLPGLRA